MTWPVIILDGPCLNQTLSSICFDQFGRATNQEYHVCSNWSQGWVWALAHGHAQALFVRSGTMFTDWWAWHELVDTYPHQGIIAHIIFKSGEAVRLDDQCWFVNLSRFNAQDLQPQQLTLPLPIRSQQDIHDDYTPLWIKPGPESQQIHAKEFGQGLIAKQFSLGLPVVNWNQRSRQLKYFLYNSVVDLDMHKTYIDIAEGQLWILNNEPVSLAGLPRLVAPGSGLWWMLNIIYPATQHLQIVDISRTQIAFCQELWNTWNGIDYGTFVWNFVQAHNVQHCELDDPSLSQLQRLKLKSSKHFVGYVNEKFAGLAPADFATSWMHARTTKTVAFVNQDLIDWMLNNTTHDYDYVWCSNILNYKWTLLHHSPDDFKNFLSNLP